MCVLEEGRQKYTLTVVIVDARGPQERIALTANSPTFMNGLTHSLPSYYLTLYTYIFLIQFLKSKVVTNKSNIYVSFKKRKVK